MSMYLVLAELDLVLLLLQNKYEDLLVIHTAAVSMQVMLLYVRHSIPPINRSRQVELGKEVDN